MFKNSQKNDILLSCLNLKKNYMIGFKKLEVLKGIDFELRKADMVFIVGRSGSGKSTLLHILGGLDKPSAGDVFFRGKQIYKLNNKKIALYRNHYIGFVFQFFYLIPELNVIENLILPSLIAREKTKTAKARALVLLDEIGLSARIKHLPRQLSGGELQRLSLARALMNEPDIVFCDEPTGNLDDESSEIIMNLIRKLNNDKKQTFCIVTHDNSFYAKSDKVYKLQKGVLIKE